MTAAFALLHDLLPAWLATIWLVSVAWVRHDARRRVRNGHTVLLATAVAAALPLAGAAAWALVRPPQTLEERRRRRLARLLVELEAGAPFRHDPVSEPEPATAPVRPLARRLAAAR